MRERFGFASEKDVAEFIEFLRSDLAEGYRVVPFVGAGFSAAAGFPLLADLEERELPYWIVRALGLNPWATSTSSLQDRNSTWNPRTGGWPPMASEISLHATRSHDGLSAATKSAGGDAPATPYSKKRARKVLKLAARALRDNPEMEGITHYVVSEALEALKREWRAMIEFLACLRRRTRNSLRIFSLGTVDNSVMDSLFSHLNQRRKPALTHRMMEALAPVWRSHILLTTNFDTLIEQAFQSTSTALRPFDVPRSTSLPDAGLVLAQRSLVKLHGGRFGLRADDSIDRPADEPDVENFVAYLAGRRVSGDTCDDKVAIFASGLSCRDRRTQSLLQAANERFRNLRIYWLGFTDGFPQFLESQMPGLNRQFHKVAHPDHGLFLLQLYQALTHTIPTSGVIFPGLWQLPAPPVIPPPEEYAGESSPAGCLSPRSAYAAACDALRSETQAELKSTRRHPVVLNMLAGDRGGVTVCANLFTDAAWHRQEKIRPLWLDLDDIAQPAGVFLRLVLMAAKADGEPDPVSTLDLHAFDDPDSELRDSFFSALGLALAHTYARSGRRLLVFINAQEGASGNSDSAKNHHSKGWDDGASWTRFRQVLFKLNEHDHYGVQFVVVVRGSATAETGGDTLRSGIDALTFATAFTRPEQYPRGGDSSRPNSRSLQHFRTRGLRSARSR